MPGVVVISTAQLHLTKSELRFCAISNPACDVSEICDGKNLWQWFRLEIMRERLSSVNHTTKTTTIIIIKQSFTFWLFYPFHNALGIISSFCFDFLGECKNFLHNFLFFFSFLFSDSLCIVYKHQHVIYFIYFLYFKFYNTFGTVFSTLKLILTKIYLLWEQITFQS